MAKDLLQSIEIALKDFGTRPLKDASLALLGVLEYESKRTIALDFSRPAERRASRPTRRARTA